LHYLKILFVRLRLYICRVLKALRCRGFPEAFNFFHWRLPVKQVDTWACIAYCSWIHQQRFGIYDLFLEVFALCFLPPLFQSFRYFAIRLAILYANKKGNLNRVESQAHENITRRNIRQLFWRKLQSPIREGEW